MQTGQVHTSFIPKQAAPTRRKKGKPMGFLVVVGVIILILSLLGWGWAYLRVQNLAESKAFYAAELEKSKKAFEPGYLRELEELDFKLKAANSLLDEHISLSQFFASLENETLIKVRYSSLSISESGSKYFVKLKGEAVSYEAIALQADAFSANPAYSNAVFSSLALRDDTKVDFSLDFILNSELISYRNSVSGAVDSSLNTSVE